MPTSNFACTFIGWIGKKAHLNFRKKVAMGVLWESGTFSGHSYIGHIARSSLW